MMGRRAFRIAGAACLAMMSQSPASAQTFQTYRCADGSQFSTGFFPSDKRAFVQIDGKPVTLSRRLGIAGRRYAGSGVTLTFAKKGVILRHMKRPATVCGES